MFPECHTRFMPIFIQPEFSLLTKARNEELCKLLVQQKPLMLGSGQDSLSCCQNCAHAACRVCEALQQRLYDTPLHFLYEMGIPKYRLE